MLCLAIDASSPRLLPPFGRTVNRVYSRHTCMRTRRRLAISIIAVCFTIPGVYLVIDAVYGIHYDFGMPAVSMIVISHPQ